MEDSPALKLARSAQDCKDCTGNCQDSFDSFVVHRVGRSFLCGLRSCFRMEPVIRLLIALAGLGAPTVPGLRVGLEVQAAQRASAASASAGSSAIRYTACRESEVSRAIADTLAPCASIVRTVSSCATVYEGFRPR